jgi:predicted transcriptional regulator
MPTRVLLSVKPRFAEAILAGTKKFEFRRALFRNPDVDTVVLYASSPIQRVIGEFRIADILALTPDELWARTHRWSGIDRTYFDEYFHEREVGFALQVERARAYRRPLSLLQHFGISYPPQSFCYLS